MILYSKSENESRYKIFSNEGKLIATGEALSATFSEYFFPKLGLFRSCGNGTPTQNNLFIKKDVFQKVENVFEAILEQAIDLESNDYIDEHCVCWNCNEGIYRGVLLNSCDQHLIHYRCTSCGDLQLSHMSKRILLNIFENSEEKYQKELDRQEFLHEIGEY